MKKVFLLLILVLFVPILFLDFFTDANVYAYMGRLIVEGRTPYIDGWDHKGISLYLINALGYGVFGFKSLIGIRIFELLLILFAFFRFFKYAAKEHSRLLALIAGIFGLFTFKYFFDGGNMTEEYGAIFSLLSVLLLLKKEVKTIDYALVGAFFILNFTIRANLIALWIALFFVYFIRLCIQKEQFQEILWKFIKIAYGALTVVLVLGLYLFATDSFQPFIDAAFTFNFSYSGASQNSVLKTILLTLKTYHLSIILLVGFGVAFLRFWKDKTRLLELLLVLWIPLELYLGNVSNRRYAHYFLMWMPLILFSVLVIGAEIKQRWNPSPLKFILGTLLVFCMCYYVPSYLSLRDWKKVISGSENQQREAVIEHIKKHYPNHTLLVWGNDSYLYNQLDVFTPITQFYQSVFKYNTEVTRKQMKEFSQQVQEHTPMLLIDTQMRGMLRLNAENTAEIDESQREGLKEFLDLIQTHYVQKEDAFGMSFFELKTYE